MFVYYIKSIADSYFREDSCWIRTRLCKVIHSFSKFLHIGSALDKEKDSL